MSEVVSRPVRPKHSGRPPAKGRRWLQRAL